MAAGEAVQQGEDGRQRNLLHEDQVMDDGEQEDEVSLLFQTRQQRGGLSVLPSGGGRGAGEVSVQREDVELALAREDIDALGGGGIAFERDHASAQ